jgi:hypothetical protein
VRRVAIACAILAGSFPARAQPAPPPTAPTPGAPDPSAPPADPPPDPTGEAAPTPSVTPPPAAVPRDALAEPRIDRELAEQQCADHSPTCDWLATLSSLERASLSRALSARGYELDPEPWNKRVGKVSVYNEEVFAEGNRFLRFFNHFHVTTKEKTIRAEAVIGPGEIWDQARVEETARRLRDPLWTSVVAVVPVRSSVPGTVDLLIVTRDIWSLRLNTQYTFQQGKLTSLVMSLAENNFLGRRNVLAAALTMDQGSIALGPLFIDKNVLHQHLDLRARVDEILNRDALFDHGHLDSEGTQSTITLARPLWSLASEWAASVAFTHRFAIDRQYRGTKLRTFDYVDPDTMATTSFDRLYHMRRWGTTASVTRQWGTAVKQQLSIGHSYDSQRPTPLADFPGDATERAAFIASVLPRSEVTSVPYLEYVFFVPRYRTLRNVVTFDLAEDTRIGPDLDVTLGFGLRALGSDHNFQRLSGTAGWTVPLARDGFARVAGALAGRYQDGELIDNTGAASLKIAAPPIARAVRLMAAVQIATRWNDRQNQFYAIGSDTGLRGFAINEFIGQRVFGTQVEARTAPYPLWVLRIGGVAFYDVGGAANSIARMDLHHDVGLGVRMLIPQTSAQLLKIDLAVPLDGANRGTLHFLAGFGSEF